MILFQTFENIIKKILVPIAEKLDRQTHLMAIKKGMVVLTPILLLGSMAYPLRAFKNLFDDCHLIHDWFINNDYLVELLIKLSLGFIAIYAVMSIAYFLSEKYKIYTVGAVSLAMLSFMIMTSKVNEDGSLDIKYFDSKGLFTAIFIAIITVEIYRYFTNRKLIIKMPEGVSDFVARSFELIIPAAFIAVFFISCRYAIFELTDGLLLPEIIGEILAPVVGSLDNLFCVWILIMFRSLFWFFGIHSSVLNPILVPILVQYFAENVAAKEAGVALPHFLSTGVYSAFVNFTGSGVTIGLMLCMLMSKSKRYKKIAQVSFIPGIFGINEPILFGAPIILNPILFIPFVIGGSLLGLFPIVLIKYDFLARPFFNPPYLPVFFEGYLTGFDWKAPFVQMLQIVLSFLVYSPFFKLLERIELKDELEKKVNLEKDKIFSKEDKEILNELDLDF